MSFISKIKSEKILITSTLSLLKNNADWELENEGNFLEKFKHKDNGWYFYTGCNMCRFYKNDNYDTYELDIGFIRYLWFVLSSKEKKFVQNWLKENDNEKPTS